MTVHTGHRSPPSNCQQTSRSFRAYWQGLPPWQGPESRRRAWPRTQRLGVQADGEGAGKAVPEVERHGADGVVGVGGHVQKRLHRRADLQAGTELADFAPRQGSTQGEAAGIHCSVGRTPGHSSSAQRTRRRALAGRNRRASPLGARCKSHPVPATHAWLTASMHDKAPCSGAPCGAWVPFPLPESPGHRPDDGPQTPTAGPCPRPRTCGPPSAMSPV